MKGGWPDRLLQVFAALLVVAMLATVTAGVVSRAAGHPLSWTDEAAGYLMVWLACSGWMLATRHGAHIRIRFFQDLLPPTAWRGAELAIQLALALFGGVIAWYSVHLMRTNADIEAMALPLTVAWMYAPLLPAGLVTLGQALYEAQARLRGREPRVPVAPS